MVVINVTLVSVPFTIISNDTIGDNWEWPASVVTAEWERPQSDHNETLGDKRAIISILSGYESDMW